MTHRKSHTEDGDDFEGDDDFVRGKDHKKKGGGKGHASGDRQDFEEDAKSRRKQNPKREQR